MALRAQSVNISSTTVTLLRRRLDEASDASFERSVSEGRAQHVRSGFPPPAGAAVCSPMGAAQAGANEGRPRPLPPRVRVAHPNSPAPPPAAAGLRHRTGEEAK